MILKYIYKKVKADFEHNRFIKTYKKTVLLGIISFIVFLFVAGAAALYNITLQRDISASTNETLLEVMNQQRQVLCSELTSKRDIIQYTAHLLETMTQEDTKHETILQALFDGVSKSGFQEIFIATVAGDAVSNSGFKANIADREYFKRALLGESYISSVIELRSNKTPAIMFAAPLRYNHETIGVVAGAYDIETFSKLITPTFNGLGSVNVMAENGDTILSISSDGTGYKYRGGNFFDVFKPDAVKILDGDDLDTILKKFNTKTFGNTMYTFGTEPRIMHYGPLGINDWIITSVVKVTVIEKTARLIRFRSIFLTVFTILLFLLLILYIVRQNAKTSKKLEQLAYYDEQSGAPNLAKFKLKLEHILEFNRNNNFAVMKFDVVKFKSINELYGFEIGDMFIRLIAKTLTEFTQKEAHTEFARISNDTFLLLDCIKISKNDNYDMLLQKFSARVISLTQKIIENAHFLYGHRTEFRFGRYILDKKETGTAEILEKVNLAYAKAKAQSVNMICEYDSEMKEKLIKETEIENKFAGALKNNEFKLFVQPKYNIESEKIVGGEALVRWIPENSKPIFPNDFIPLLEKTGNIRDLDFKMLEYTCQMLQSMIENNIETVRISVNFSRIHIYSKDFVQNLRLMVDKYNVPHDLIELEITESVAMENEQTLFLFMLNIQNAGFTIAMDDFGTGYSSLGSLKNMPIDSLKLDRSFFVDAKNNPRSYAVVEAISDMTKKLKMKTVAEGVEKKEQIDMLQELGYEVVQGYFYAKPMPVYDFVELMKKQHAEKKIPKGLLQKIEEKYG